MPGEEGATGRLTLNSVPVAHEPHVSGVKHSGAVPVDMNCRDIAYVEHDDATGSSVHPFVPLNGSSVHPFIHSTVHPFIRSSTQWFIRSSVHPI